MQIPLKCPRASECTLKCSAKAETTSKRVEALFIFDKHIDGAVKMIKTIAKDLKITYAISYTMRYYGKKSRDCMPALISDIKRVKPEVLIFVGNGGLRFFEKNCGSEYEERGFFRDINLKGKTFDGILTLHPSAVKEKPQLAGFIFNDIKKAIHPKLRKLRIKKGKPELLLKYKDVKEYMDYLQRGTKSKVVALDTETKNVNARFGNKVATWQFSDDGKTGYVIPWQHKEAPWDISEQKKIKNLFIKLFTEPTEFKALIAHHMRFDLNKVWTQFGVMPHQVLIDTMACFWLLDENRLDFGKGAFRLEKLFREWNFEKYDDEDVGADVAPEDLFDLPLKQLAGYGARDTYGDFQLYYIAKELAKAQNYHTQWSRQLKYYWSIIYKMFTIMEYNGAPVDLEQIRFLKSPHSPIRKRMREIETDFGKLKSVKKVNKLMLSENGVGSMPTLFGGAAAPNLFNINKTDSKRRLFFDILKLEPPSYGKVDRSTVTDGKECRHDKFNKTEEVGCVKCKKCGGLSYGKLDKSFQTDYETVKEVSMLTEYTQLKKLSTSYVNQLYRYVDPEEGDEDCQDCRVRPQQNPHGTVTVRASTSNPNTAQIPRADERDCPKCKGDDKEKLSCIKCFGKGVVPGPKAQIKDLFICEPGKLLTQVDYATAEIRGLGIISGDRSLAKLYNKAFADMMAFRADPTNEKLKNIASLSGDIHKLTASLMFGIPIEKVTKALRTAAKSIVFGLVYGMGVSTLADNLGKSKKETQALIDKFFSRFPDAKKWLEQEKKNIRKNMYIESPLGIRRRLWAFMTEEEWAQARAERQGPNAAIQGMCAQFAMIGCSLVNQYILDNDLINKWGWEINNYVHDSLTYQILPQYHWKSVQIVEKLMGQGVMDYCTEHFGMKFNLPICVDAEVGLKLGSLKPLDGTKLQYKRIMKQLGLSVNNKRWRFDVAS